jgi:hypothetical protein
MPVAHRNEGLARAAAVTHPCTFLLYGFSNSRQEMYAALNLNDAWNNPARFRSDLTVELQADSGQAKPVYLELDAGNNPYNETAARLTPAQISQLQIAYGGIATPILDPRYAGLGHLKDGTPYASTYLKKSLQDWGEIIRKMKVKYPGLTMMILCERTSAAYGDTSHNNSEPSAREESIQIAELVKAQVGEVAGGTIHADIGSLDYRNGTAPWLCWGPQLWAPTAGVQGAQTPVAIASGTSRGLAWNDLDFEQAGQPPNGDRVHPFLEQKMGRVHLWYWMTNEFLAPLRTA